MYLFHYIILYYIIFYYILLYFIIFYYISLYFIIFHYISLNIILIHYNSLYFIIFQKIIFYYIILYYTMGHLYKAVPQPCQPYLLWPETNYTRRNYRKRQLLALIVGVSSGVPNMVLKDWIMTLGILLQFWALEKIIGSIDYVVNIR